MANVGIHSVRDETLTAAKGCSSASFCWHFETLGAQTKPTTEKIEKSVRKNQTNPTIITHHPSDLGETQTENPPDLGKTQTGNASEPRQMRKKQKKQGKKKPQPLHLHHHYCANPHATPPPEISPPPPNHTVTSSKSGSLNKHFIHKPNGVWLIITS
ncbi:hypothetical protein RHMOL_Rhmol01G0227200 [Rhododendron molle]|uniref:Uncharacterized protein n=1 Tax=Rhododendron molle TaxID=49168 RepID=A0ACC0Q5Q1_RHOML|nr:hypothetical protein RHMOL_Rhmol01G0227200 [Rhododendron molle]